MSYIHLPCEEFIYMLQQIFCCTLNGKYHKLEMEEKVRS